MLIINHHFDQDILALIEGCRSRYSFFVIECMPFFNQAELFFRTDADRDGSIAYPDLAEADRMGYRNVAEGLFDDLYELFPFEAILVPSEQFWWVREFLEVAAARGKARVVVDKEGMITPYSFEVHSQQVKESYPFISDVVLVWSKRQREFWIKSGAPPERIEIVGQPRSDFFFTEERWLSKEALGLSIAKRTILFFTFDIDAYIHIFPAEQIQRESLSWLPLRNDIHRSLIEFAAENDDVEVIVKAHPQQPDIPEVRRMFRDAGLANVKILEGAGLSNHLIVRADLIIGFQTTAMIESLLTEKPVVYTAWGATEEALRDLLIPLGSCEGLEIADSRESLLQILNHWHAGQHVGGDRSRRREFTDYYLGADGKVCERVAGAMAQVIERVRGEVRTG